MDTLGIIFILVKRDYALQFAGSFLGITWMLIQNLSMILIYTLVFGLLQTRAGAHSANFSLPYVFSGLLFYFPLQEMLIRGCSILSDNRKLIKRSALGMEIFLWIPYFQMLVHFLITSLPVFLYLYWLQGLKATFLLSYLFIPLAGLFIHSLLHYLARINVILKDISPLVRLASQFLFWGLPILYYPSGILKDLNRINPLNVPLDIFRLLVIKGYQLQFSWLQWTPFLLIALMLFFLSRRRLNSVILDHL
ncbi:MAG: ABC transporter permease [Leptospiraceae bacterium]|nr:ABC transporter permease [Leptospiraceae bacterium]